MISESQCFSEFQIICEISKQTMQNPWNIRKVEWQKNLIWAENSEFIVSKIDSKKFKRVSSICYSQSYNVPVFWFNFYDIDGKLIHFDQFKEFAFVQPQQFDLNEFISQAEHPFLGIAFYNLHPCKTAELMRPISLETNNYILSFLSIINSIFVTNWPMKFFAAGLMVKNENGEENIGKELNEKSATNKDKI